MLAYAVPEEPPAGLVSLVPLAAPARLFAASLAPLEFFVLFWYLFPFHLVLESNLRLTFQKKQTKKEVYPSPTSYFLCMLHKYKNIRSFAYASLPGNPHLLFFGSPGPFSTSRCFDDGD